MEKHIVFVMGRFLPERSANVNCIENIIAEMQESGYQITVVCSSALKSEKTCIDKTDVYRTQYISYAHKLSRCKSLVLRKFLVLGHFLKSVFVLPIYPNVTPLITYKTYKKIVEIHENKKIDCVIGVFQPYFPIGAILKFKKKFTNIPVIGYYLDVMKGTNKPFGITQKMFEKMCDMTQTRDFSRLDRVILPECSRVYYESEKYAAVKEKISYLNFPTLLKKNYIGENATDSLVFAFAGTTNRIYRNPTRAIEIFLKLAMRKPGLTFHLYGASDMVKELKEFEKCSNGAFVYHGVVSKERADAVLKMADFCVNFGNDVLGMVPSKVFEMISLGKSIVHFTPGSTDSSSYYMKKYKKAHVVDVKKADEKIISELLDFMNKEKMDISFDEIENTFYSATPRAVACEISKML